MNKCKCCGMNFYESELEGFCDNCIRKYAETYGISGKGFKEYCEKNDCTVCKYYNYCDNFFDDFPINMSEAKVDGKLAQHPIYEDSEVR